MNAAKAISTKNVNNTGSTVASCLRNGAYSKLNRSLSNSTIEQIQNLYANRLIEGLLVISRPVS